MDSITTSGVMYEIVSNVPKASEELEDRESLAQLAASGNIFHLNKYIYIHIYVLDVKLKFQP